MKAILVFIALMHGVLASAFAAESVPQALKEAEAALKAKNYPRAIQKTRPLLDGLKLGTTEEIVAAHKILGVSYCETGEVELSVQHFGALTVFAPNETIDPYDGTAKCRDLFRQVKGIEAEPPQPTSPPPSSARVTPPQRATSTDFTWKHFVPYGTGQFAHEQRGKAWTFLVLESVFTASTITSAILFQSERETNGTFDNPDRAEALRTMFWASFGATIVSMSWGIADALIDHGATTSAHASRWNVSPSYVAYRF